MSLRRLEVLQWLGLIAGGVIWAAQHVVGYGITEAVCDPGGRPWGISHDVWQASLMIAAALLILGAEAASLAVLLATRSSSYEDAPAQGRIRFFAIAAMAANAIFLMIVLLDGVAAIANVECRKA